MSVYDEEKLYNELMNGAPVPEHNSSTLNSSSALANAENTNVPGEYKGSTADEKLDEAINKYLNDRGFNYNTADDPDYQAYVKEYKENANKGRVLSGSTAKTLANGYDPTYADTVSDEVYNSYMGNVTDAVPQFKNLAALENAGERQQLANALNIYGIQSQKDYSRYRDTVGDKKNFLNYLYNRYATDRQSDVQQNSDKASIYGTKLSSAQSNLEKARTIDTQRYLHDTQSADNAAQQKLNNEKEKAEDKSKYKKSYYEKSHNVNDFIEAYNLKNANYNYVRDQIAMGYYNQHISTGEMDYLADKFKIDPDEVANRLDEIQRSGRRYGGE